MKISDIRPLLRMPLQIPAGLHVCVRKQSIDASLGRRWVKDKLRLSTLLRNRVIVTDDHRPVRIAMSKHPQPEKSQVNCKYQNSDAKQKHHETQGNPPYSIPQVERSFRHRPDYTAEAMLERSAASSAASSVDNSVFDRQTTAFAGNLIPGERQGRVSCIFALPGRILRTHFVHGHDRTTGLLHA